MWNDPPNPPHPPNPHLLSVLDASPFRISSPFLMPVRGVFAL